MRRRANHANKRQLPDEHTAKYHPGKDPLEQEAGLNDIRPLAKIEQKRMMDVINQMIQQPGLTADEKKALRMFKANYAVDGVKQTVQQEFLRDFWGWLIGRGTDEDHAKTWWGRQSLADDHEVATYIDLFVTKMHEFRVKLRLLEVRRPIGINQVYLYYKYIVRGEGTDASNFLEDWQIFMDEFNTAREFGQDWMDKEKWVHPHETAPYGDLRAQMGQTRSERLFRNDVRNLTGGLGDRQPDYDDDTEDDPPPPPPSSGQPVRPPPRGPTGGPAPASKPPIPTVSTGAPMEVDDADGPFIETMPDPDEMLQALIAVNQEVQAMETEDDNDRQEKQRRKREKAKAKEEKKKNRPKRDEAADSAPAPKPLPPPPKIPALTNHEPVPASPNNALAAVPKLKAVRSAQKQTARDRMRRANERARDLRSKGDTLQDRIKNLKRKEESVEAGQKIRALTGPEEKKAEETSKELVSVKNELESLKREKAEIARDRDMAREGFRQVNEMRVLEKTLKEANLKEVERLKKMGEENDSKYRDSLELWKKRLRDQHEALREGHIKKIDEWKVEHKDLNDVLDGRQKDRSKGKAPLALSDRVQEEDARRESEVFGQMAGALEKFGGDYSKSVESLLDKREANRDEIVSTLRDATTKSIERLAGDLKQMEQYIGQEGRYQDIVNSYLEDARRTFNDVAESTSALNPRDTQKLIDHLDNMRNQVLEQIMARYQSDQATEYARRGDLQMQQLEKWGISEIQRRRQKQMQENADRLLKETSKIAELGAIASAGRHEAKVSNSVNELALAASDKNVSARAREAARKAEEQANKRVEILDDEIDQSAKTLAKAKKGNKRLEREYEQKVNQLPQLEAAEIQASQGAMVVYEGERSELKQQKVDLEEQEKMRQAQEEKERMDQAEAEAREREEEDKREIEAELLRQEKERKAEEKKAREDQKELERREREEAHAKAIEDEKERQLVRVQQEQAHLEEVRAKEQAAAEKKARKEEKRKQLEEAKAAKRAEREAQRAANEQAAAERHRRQQEEKQKQIEENRRRMEKKQKQIEEERQRMMQMVAHRTKVRTDLQAMEEEAPHMDETEEEAKQQAVVVHREMTAKEKKKKEKEALHKLQVEQASQLLGLTPAQVEQDIDKKGLKKLMGDVEHDVKKRDMPVAEGKGKEEADEDTEEDLDIRKRIKA